MDDDVISNQKRNFYGISKGGDNPNLPSIKWIGDPVTQLKQND